MTKIERITLLGDIIVQLDIQRGSLSPGTPRRKKLDEIRGILNEKQLELADLVFDEGTTAYKAATDKLTTLDKDIRNTINDINKVAETFAALASLVTAIDELLMLATSIG
jgi:hypothetical protein